MLLKTKQDKYQLIKTDKISANNKPLYQIKANYDFADIKKGQLGGYVESIRNLSQYGNSWIYGQAQAIGDARIQGDAKLKGNDVTVLNENIVLGNGTEIKGDSDFKSKNISAEKSIINDVSTDENTENIIIKKSTVSGVKFKGSNIKIVNSTVTGDIILQDGVVLNGVKIDANGLTIKNNVIISDTVIVGNGDEIYELIIQNNSTIIGSKISMTGFTSVVFDSIDFENVKIGCGKNSKLSDALITGKLYDSLIGFNGESNNITMSFNGKINNICVSKSNKLTIENYNNENLFISADNTTLDSESVCKGTVMLGCTGTANLSQLDIIDQKATTGYKQPDLSNAGGGGTNKLNNFTITDKSTLDGCIIRKSNNTQIGSSSYVSANIMESNNLHIYAKVKGNINKCNNVYVENNACINGMNEASNIRICGNSTITSLSGNCNGRVINGDSYINGDNISGCVINSTDYSGDDTVKDTIINNSEVNGIESNGKIINNSVVTGEVLHNEYDNRPQQNP